MTKSDPSKFYIIGVLIIALIPHMPRLPLWITVWCLVLWFYIPAGPRLKLPRPSKKVIHILTLAGIAGTAVTVGNIFTKEGGVAATAVLMGLKPFEIKGHRDRMVTIFAAYFLIIANLFVSESLAAILYMAGAVVITQAVLIRVNHPRRTPWSALRLSGAILIQALPLVAVLFVLFPRFPLSLGLTVQTAQTGFGEELAPGDVSNLARNNEIAFRVEFPEPVPSLEDLYWRGLVLWHFDGLRWTRGLRIQWSPLAMPESRDPVKYSVILEPHGRRWLFALDLPVVSPPGARLMADFTLATWPRVGNRRRYEVESHRRYHTGPFRRWEQSALSLPAGGNPRTRNLAREWASRAGSPEEVIRIALDYFRNGKFIYTLNPTPPSGGDIIDDLLFQSRRGFCEHYASAFAYLVRAAGLPARIVAGYLGGERNPMGNYLIVRQSDAHAWVEVFLEKKGWVRVDPTLVVAPERSRTGVAAALSPNEAGRFLKLQDLRGLGRIWKRIRLVWDAANFYWARWVLDYNYLTQQNLLAGLGLETGHWKGRVLALLLALVLLLALAGLILFRLHGNRKHSPSDPVRETYDRFRAKLALRKIPHRPHQGPREFADKTIKTRPDLAPQILEITDLYIRLRYGPNPSSFHEKKLKRLVRRFKP